MLGGSRLIAVTLATFLAGPSMPACLKKKPAPQPALSASASVSASAPVLSASVAPDAGPPPRTAQLERSRQWLADLKSMLARKTSTNPRKEGNGDAASTCEAVESARAAMDAGAGTDADAEYRTNLEEAATLCAFDVPLLTASEALDQLRFSPSQASRLLMCKVSRRELDRARAVHPRDARVQKVESRRLNLCR